jgi:hypothetical protein
LVKPTFAPIRDCCRSTDPRAVRATFDERTVLVWQAHTPEVAAAAVADGRYGPRICWSERSTRFRLSLPALLDRNGWGTAPGRECILGVRVLREGFDALLRQAVHDAMEPELYPSRNAWHLARRYANVCIAWHADVDPAGNALEWETLRVEVRDHALKRFVREWVVGIEDWTPWVRANRPLVERSLPVPAIAPYPLPEADRLRLAGRRV